MEITFNIPSDCRLVTLALHHDGLFGCVLQAPGPLPSGGKGAACLGFGRGFTPQEAVNAAHAPLQERILKFPEELKRLQEFAATVKEARPQVSVQLLTLDDLDL